MIVFKTSGTCAKEIHFKVEDGVITYCEFFEGCSGNLSGLSRLLTGKRPEDVISLLKGIQCQNGTSCPDQLAIALEGWCMENGHAI